MSSASVQQLCELGSEQLIQTRYLEAEAALTDAESQSWKDQDWDTLARLYMPLQEARRQRRQCCGEGIVALDLVAQGPHDAVEAKRVLENFSHGQLLVAGWRSIEPAVQVRRLAAEHGLYVETFLGAVFPVGKSKVVIVAPLEESILPPGDFQSADEFREALPPHCLLLDPRETAGGQRKGTPQTFGEVMAIWERLHAPFLAQSDAQPDPLRQIEGYRLTTRVDYASELAHQKLSNVAHELARAKRRQRQV
jgi:hypothetical protein